MPLAVIFCYLMHWHSDILKCGLSVQMLFGVTNSFVSSMLAQKWIRLLCCTPGVLWLWLSYMRLLYYSVLLNFKWTLFLFFVLCLEFSLLLICLSGTALDMVIYEVFCSACCKILQFFCISLLLHGAIKRELP